MTTTNYYTDRETGELIAVCNIHGEYPEHSVIGCPTCYADDETEREPADEERI